MDEKEQKAFDALPKPPEGSTFTLLKVITNTTPHPFMIGPRHVAIAADQFGGMLSDAALDAAYSAGYGCQMPTERGHGPKCGLSHRDHKSELVALIETPFKLKSNVKEVPGLHEYLLSIKETAEKAGIAGFGFPHRK